MDDIARATAVGLMRDARGAAGELSVELQCECPIHTYLLQLLRSRSRESRYLGVREKSGLLQLRSNAKRRDILAFLFTAKLGDVTSTHVMLANCNKVMLRGTMPSPPNWKAWIAASALPCRIKAKAEELREHVEVECAFLGVPKLVSTPAAFGAVPGALAALTASGQPLVVILCAPLNETEW